MQLKDLHKFQVLNTDDDPSNLTLDEVTDAFNVRMGSSTAQHGSGVAETLQGEVELILGVAAEFEYYGEAIGGQFIYEGFSEVTIGNQVWMKKNWGGEYPGSKVYDDDPDNIDIYGRLYTHGQVMAIDFCPDGWHVSTEAEMDTLLNYLTGEAVAGGLMKEAGTDHWSAPNTGAVNSSGFKALPGGKYDLLFELLGESCLLWLQDESTPTIPTALAATDKTYNSFLANWELDANPDGYWLDVATDIGFTAFVAGFNNKDVGKVSSYSVTGLTPDVTYYYRVRAYNEIGSSASSNIITIKTLYAVADADGNLYNVVNISTQQWFVENLKTTKYADGSAIPNLIISDYNDWFLPSKDELTAMYDELKLFGVGDFGVLDYWSSSEGSASQAYVKYFSTGASLDRIKSGTAAVRACRAFTTTTVYALRDTGPTGGLIFYKNGDDYLEAAPSNQSDSCAWSNIVTPDLGTTGTAIGTGQSNTTAIIGQAGHTASAAKLCNDLSVAGWINDTLGAYCWYNNDIANKADYGALYNKYAVDHAAPASLAPTGWRIPSDADYNTLVAFIGGDTVAGGKLKEIGISHWTTPNTGATDEYGFKGLPSGNRSYLTASFGSMNNSFFAWDSDNKFFALAYNQINSSLSLGNAGYGFAVRCMRDLP